MALRQIGWAAGCLSLVSLFGACTGRADEEAPGTTTDEENETGSHGGAHDETGAGAETSDTDSGSDLGGTVPDPESIDCRSDGDGLTTLVFANGCATAVTFRGSDIDDGTLEPGEFVCIDLGTDAEPINSKRYWGFSGQDPGAEHHTLAEFTFNTDFNDFDWYNISHVDAHNLPLQIVPVGRSDCEVLTCQENWLESCPDEGQFKDDAGETIACVSPDRDNAQSPVAQFFEACDEAYAWSGDDQHGDDPSPMRACAGEDWDIVFCPEAEP